MKQKEYVIEAMKRNGGYATFQQLNQMVDFSTWKTKTPHASIRRIVQQGNEFFKIRPGLWALKECEEVVLNRLQIIKNNSTSEGLFTHSYYQGIIVEIGNMRNHDTYIPPQDKNKLFLERKLGEISKTTEIYQFAYPELLRKAKTIDAIWFNERKMPCAFYEVEHSTDIKNSLSKFYELQDFRAKFYIVAAKERRNQFNDILSASMYKPIQELVKFIDYDSLVEQYNLQSRVISVI